MGLIIGVVIALAAAVVVVWPFLRRGADLETAEGDTPEALQAVQAQREAALEELRLLRLDRELGSIDEREYEARLQQMRVRAATLLRRETLLASDLRARESEIEREIRAARAGLRRGQDGTSGS